MSGASRLEWPVNHGGAVTVRPDGEEFTWREGTPEDRQFGVASVTKLLTSLATLVAVERGKLELHAAVPTEVPPPGYRGTLPEAGVTVRHLLAHASGLPQEEGGRRTASERRRIYSSVGYRLLGALVADAVGEPFPDWLDTAVLRPLGMRATHLATYKDIPADPAAGAVSSLPDLALLAGCLLDRGAPVLGPELFAEAVTSHFPDLAGLVPGVGRFNPCDWGLGPELKGTKAPHWMGSRRSAASFGHFGAKGSFLWVDPEAGVAAAAATDRDFGPWALEAWPAWSDAR